MKKECVFDGSISELNTSMSIKLDSGTEVEVWVCDNCAEDATLRSIKSAYMERYADNIAKDKEIQDLLAKAKELGLEISIPGAEPQIEQSQKSEQTQEFNVKKGNLVMDSREADTKTINPTIKEGGGRSPYGGASAGQGQEYQIRSDSQASEDLREGEVAEVAIVEGRQGMPIKMPVSRRGKMGTTKINIKQTMNDAQLQAKFKDMANASVNDQGPSFKDGYDVRFVVCTLCRGNGSVRGQECPKCGGVGEIQAG